MPEKQPNDVRLPTYVNVGGSTFLFGDGGQMKASGLSALGETPRRAQSHLALPASPMT